MAPSGTNPITTARGATQQITTAIALGAAKKSSTSQEARRSFGFSKQPHPHHSHATSRHSDFPFSPHSSSFCQLHSHSTKSLHFCSSHRILLRSTSVPLYQASFAPANLEATLFFASGRSGRTARTTEPNIEQTKLENTRSVPCLAMPLGFKALGFEAPDPSATATEAASPLAGLPSDSRDAGQIASQFNDTGKGGLVSTHSMAPDEDFDIEGRPPYIHVCCDSFDAPHCLDKCRLTQ